jgi:outer membrane protein TolC
MSLWRDRFTSGALLAVLALSPAAAWAQTTQLPVPPQTPPSGAPTLVVPPVPAVPTITGGVPLSLADAVAAALQRNFTIRLQALQVLIAQSQVAQAEAGVLPKVTMTGTYNDVFQQSPPNPITINVNGTPVTFTLPQSPNPLYTFGLTLAYPLYSGGALQDQIAIARANYAGSQAQLLATTAQVVLQVRQAYYQVQLAQGQVAAAQRAVDAARENVRVTEARVRVGSSPQFDLLQAQAQLAQFEQSLTQAKANAVQAQENLDIVVNQPQTTVVSTTTPLGLPQPPQDQESLVAMALRSRPELVASQAAIRAQQAGVDLAAAGLRPTVTISGGGAVQTGDPTAKFPVNWNGMITAAWAIWDGGLTPAKVDQARQQLAVSQTQDAQLRQTVEQQVRSAYLSLQNSAETLRSALSQLVAAREQLRIANVRFAAGVGTQLEVVQAEQTLATADLAVVQAQYNYNLAIAQIDQATGTQVKF